MFKIGDIRHKTPSLKNYSPIRNFQFRRGQKIVNSVVDKKQFTISQVQTEARHTITGVNHFIFSRIKTVNLYKWLPQSLGTCLRPEHQLELLNGNNVSDPCNAEP